MAARGEFSIERIGAAYPPVENIGVDELRVSKTTLRFERRSVRSRLTDAIEAEIAPRLMLLHAESLPREQEDRPSFAEIEQLATLAIAKDEAAATAYFEDLRGRDYSLATLLSHLIAPAARHLDELWRQDYCDLFDVAVAEGRLQAIMDRFASTETPISDYRRRAVLIAPPGETRVFGAKVVAKFLEIKGWDVTFKQANAPRDAADTVADEWVGVVGVTVNAVERLELAARTIAQVRSASLNRDIGVMVGGSVIDEENLGYAARLGADGAWLDAPSAAALSARLLKSQSSAKTLIALALASVSTS